MLEIHFTQRPFLRWRRHETMSEKAVGWVALSVSMLSGSTFHGYAKVLTTALSSLSLMFLSELLTAFFVLFSYGFLPVFSRILRMHRKDFLSLLGVSMLNGIVGPIFLFTGLYYTSAVNAGFYSNMQIVFVVMLAGIVLKEKITSAHYAAIATILAGTTVIVLKGFSDGLSLHLGDVLIISSSLGYALGSVYYRKTLSHIEPHVALLMRSCVAILAFFVVSPFIPHPLIQQIKEFPLALLPALLGFAFIGRFLNSVAFYQAIDRLEVSTVSLFGSLTIVGSTLFAYLYLGEPILWYHYMGGALIILGTILLEIVGTHPDAENLEMHMKQRIP